MQRDLGLPETTVVPPSRAAKRSAEAGRGPVEAGSGRLRQACAGRLRHRRPELYMCAMTRDELLLTALLGGDASSVVLAQAAGRSERAARYGLTHLVKTGLVWSPERGRWRLTEAGRAIAATVHQLPAAPAEMHAPEAANHASTAPQSAVTHPSDAQTGAIAGDAWSIPGWLWGLGANCPGRRRAPVRGRSTADRRRTGTPVARAHSRRLAVHGLAGLGPVARLSWALRKGSLLQLSGRVVRAIGCLTAPEGGPFRVASSERSVERRSMNFGTTAVLPAHVMEDPRE